MASLDVFILRKYQTENKTSRKIIAMTIEKEYTLKGTI
jgi:hypothetical protein